MKVVTRYHDFSAGHRVCGHESKCAFLHGHNYRVHFTCEGIEHETDELGRVIDFSVIKEKLCDWLENNWDHKFLAFEDDTMLQSLHKLASESGSVEMDTTDYDNFDESIVWLSFNPTAENMAEYLLHIVGPKQLAGTGVMLTMVKIEETAKCSATVVVRSPAP